MLSLSKRLRQVTTGLVIVALMGLLVVTRSASAQTLPVDGVSQQVDANSRPLVVQQMHVQVMPQFDDHRVLVIVQGRLAADTTLPATLVVYVPRGAQINQMAEMDMDANGAIRQLPYKASPDLLDTARTRITYHLSSAHFFYEYYGRSLEGDPQKAFDWALRTAWPVEQLTVEVQEPLKAQAFTLEPLPTVVRVDDQFGFAWHSYALGAISAETPTTLHIAYTRSDPAPSLSKEQVLQMYGLAPQPAPTVAPAPTADPGSRLPTQLFWWVLASLPIGLGVILLTYFRSRWQPPLSSDSAPAFVFCSHCAARVDPHDRFCHGCGSATRMTTVATD